MKRTIKKTWSLEIDVLSLNQVKAALKENNIKLSRKDFNLFLGYLDNLVNDEIDFQVILDQGKDILEDALNDIKKELKKPVNERDILNYF